MLPNIQKIHQSNYKIFAAISGGGQSFLGDFCKISGASNNLIGGIIPYNSKMLEDFLGIKIKKYVTPEVSRKMAINAYRKCLEYSQEKNNIGIGVSCSLTKNDERIGRIHNIFVSSHDYFSTKTIQIKLNQKRNREIEESLVVKCIWSLVCEIILDEIVDEKNLNLDLDQYESFEIERKHDKNIGYLLNHETDILSSENLAPLKSISIFCGSFNPLHLGHLKIKEIAEEILKEEIFFELSVENVDKGFLDYIEIENRLKDLEKYKIILTNSPLIKDKIKTIRKYSPYAQINIILGSDSWNRLWDEKYGVKRNDLEDFLTKYGVKFLIINRENYSINHAFGKEFMIYDERLNFINNDISSTQIRENS